MNSLSVDPSAFVLIVIGRMASPSQAQASVSVFVSSTVNRRPAIEPATTFLPSGVT